MQLDPINHTLKAPGYRRLKLELEELLSDVALNFKLRRYSEVEDGDTDRNTYIKKFTWDEPDTALWKGLPPRIEVGRRRLTLSNPS